jgi:Uma2 family endonuclease
VMTTAKKLMTADDLLAMPDDGNRHELVRGELIEMPPPGIMHAIVTGRLGMRMGYSLRRTAFPSCTDRRPQPTWSGGRTRCGRPPLE